MAEIPSDDTAGIEFIQNESNILLIAPHGVETEPFDDIGTAELTRKIAAKLQCSAVINTKFRRPTGNSNAQRNNGKPSLEKKVLNLAVVKDAEQLQDFINKIKSIVATDGLTHVFWIHSTDKKINNAQCLIWYGQSKKDVTAKQVIINKLIEHFKKNKIKVIKDSTQNKNEDMNQWFLSKGYTLEQVQSIRLNFNTTYCKNTKNIEKTAEVISKAIQETITMTEANKSNNTNKLSEATGEILPPEQATVVLTPEEEQTVETAYNEIKRIFREEFKQATQNAMLSTGKYLIKMFYNDKYAEAAAEAKKRFTKNKSLAKLFEKLRQEKDGNIPQKTWLYNSVNLAIADKPYEDLQEALKEGKALDAKQQQLLSSWTGHLTVSHKITLIQAKELNENQVNDLILEIGEKPCKVLELRNRIAELKGETPKTSTSVEKLKSSVIKNFAQDKISKFNKEELKDLRKELNKILQTIKAEIDKDITATPPDLATEITA